MLYNIGKYYKPGLISLLILPVISCIYLQKYLYPTKQLCLELKVPNKNSNTQGHFPPVRNYQRIDLVGDVASDNKQMKVVETLIRKMIFDKDSVGGIYVHIGSKVRCQSLVTILDICNFENASIFGFDGDDFWIAPILCYRDEEVLPMTGRCGTKSRLK